MFYNISILVKLNQRYPHYYITKGDTPMSDTLLNNLERINVIAEILLDLISDNPRAQVLTEIIIEASQIQQ